jgi:hypothetical protein
MTYKKGFVAAIKTQKKILREKDGVVYLPFGSEYSILLKNLESRKVKVKIKIDGEDVIKNGLVLRPEETIDLERFVKDNLSEGNRFKFVQKTEEIVKHRGDRIDDGIIRIEFAFEKKKLPEIDKNIIINSAPDLPRFLDEGVTVPGSISNQRFGLVEGFETDEPQTIIFQLRGYFEAEKPVTEPIAVNTRILCPTCAKKNISSFNYCSECGTCLIQTE